MIRLKNHHQWNLYRIYNPTKYWWEESDEMGIKKCDSKPEKIPDASKCVLERK